MGMCRIPQRGLGWHGLTGGWQCRHRDVSQAILSEPWLGKQQIDTGLRITVHRTGAQGVGTGIRFMPLGGMGCFAVLPATCQDVFVQTDERTPGHPAKCQEQREEGECCCQSKRPGHDLRGLLELRKCDLSTPDWLWVLGTGLVFTVFGVALADLTIYLAVEAFIVDYWKIVMIRLTNETLLIFNNRVPRFVLGGEKLGVSRHCVSAF